MSTLTRNLGGHWKLVDKFKNKKLPTKKLLYLAKMCIKMRKKLRHSQINKS
jgi:hypothetical protein